MKASDQFLLREIAGEYILVPVGTTASGFNGLITTNEIGAFIFRALQQERTEQSLLDAVRAEYDVDADTALADLREFLEKLRRAGALTEGHD